MSVSNVSSGLQPLSLPSKSNDEHHKRQQDNKAGADTDSHKKSKSDGFSTGNGNHATDVGVNGHLMTPEEREEMIRGMVQRLADRMAENPDDLAGWQRLERAYRMMGETEKADDALTQIKRLSAQKSEAPTTQPGPTQEQMRAAQEMSPEDRAEMIRGMVQRLADRLAETPDDLAGWQRLERAYRVLGDTEKADEAAAQVKRLTP